MDRQNDNGPGDNRAAGVHRKEESGEVDRTSHRRPLQYLSTVHAIPTNRPGEEIRLSLIELDGNTLADLRIWRDGLPKRGGLFMTPRQCLEIQKALDKARVDILKRIKEGK